MKLPGWIAGGNDRQLATTYPGPSATETSQVSRQKSEDRKNSRARVARYRGAVKADRAGQAWEEQDRRRFRG